MSLIIVKLKLQMCKFRKGVLVFEIEYHVYIILIVKQPDYIPILYIFRYRKPQSFGDKVSNYSSGSIEIDPIDVSNLRRFSSLRNRIGSNRTNVTKSTVQWEFEYTFFASTLNPMGKRQCLEISDYAGDPTGNTRRHMRQSEMVQSNKKTPSLSKPSFAIWSYSLRA